MNDSRDWAVNAELDFIRISLAFRRDLDGCPIQVSIAGSSRKRSEPVFAGLLEVADPRNVEAEVGALLGSLAYYRPTDQRGFDRAMRGVPMNEHEPVLPFPD